MIDRLVVDQLAVDLLAAEAALVQRQRELIDIIADLALENAGLRLLVQNLNKGVRVERDALRAELDRYTRAQVE